VSSLNIALPDIARDLHATQTQLQWIIDGYAVVFAGLLLLAGAIGDRVGRRPVLLAGLAVFAGAAFCALFVNSPAGLIATRAVMGLGAAAIMPSTLAIITNVFPRGERDRAVAIWAGVAGASALLGLLVSGALLEVFSWKSVFGFSAVFGLIALIASSVLAPDSTADDAALDVVGGLLSVIGLSAIVYAVIEGPDRGWTDGVTLVAFGVGVLAAIAFVLWELSRERPLLDPRLFRLGGFSAGTASITVQFFAFFGFVFVILQYIQFVLGYSPFKAALALAPMALVLMALSPRVPAMLERVGPARIAPVGLLLMAAGFAVLTGAGVHSTYWRLLIAVLLLGTGAALATTPATTAIVSSLPAAKQGVASAVNDATRELGGALGIAVLGSALIGRYRGGISGLLSHAPPALAHGAKAALPAALQIAHHLGPNGRVLAARAEASFVDGLNLAMLIAAISLVLVAVFVFVRAPKRLDADATSGAGEVLVAAHES
jgi:EmrB/QacA subfamily drug resistance transporter